MLTAKSLKNEMGCYHTKLIPTHLQVTEGKARWPLAGSIMGRNPTFPSLQSLEETLLQL